MSEKSLSWTTLAATRQRPKTQRGLPLWSRAYAAGWQPQCDELPAQTLETVSTAGTQSLNGSDPDQW